jgi:rhodanese-related sulfurtransferase
MKKLPLALLLASFLFAVGCASAPKATAPAVTPIPAPVASAAAKDSPITMANLDEFLGRPEVEVVDLRNFEDRFNGGYIAGTEIIPFFQFLEGRMVSRGLVDGKPAWDAKLAQINDSFAFANYFNPKKTIILFCASGTRAAFVKTVLDKKGYATFNAGGFKDYKGPAKVLGDGVYVLPVPESH